MTRFTEGARAGGAVVGVVDRLLVWLVTVWALGALLPIGAWTGITTLARYTDTWDLWWRGSLVCGIGTLLLLLLSQGRVADWLRTGLAWVLALRSGVFLAVTGTVACLEAVAMAGVYFGRNPQIMDSWVQCFQGRIFLSGALVASPPPSFVHFAAQNMLMAPDLWASQYPPIHAALLGAGLASGAVWLVTPLLAGLLPVGAYALGRGTGDERVARLAAGLTLISPFVIAINATAMNHLPAALCVAFGLAAAAPAARGSARAGLVLGGAIGLLVGLRPLEATSLAVVGAVAVLGAVRRRSWAVPLTVAMVAVVAVVPTLVFNNVTTGSPFVFTYLRVWGAGHAIGVGHVVPWGQSVTLASALGHIGLDAHNLDAYFLEWPLPVSLLIGVGLWMRRARLDDGLRPAVGFLLVFVTGLAFYFHRDRTFGPRLLFSTVPALSVLLAAAMVRLAQIGVPTGWRRVKLGDAVLTLLAVTVVVAGVARGVRRLASYDLRHTEMALHPDEDARRLGIGNAVVLIPDGWRMRLIARMWEAGIPVADSPRIYKAFDACALEERLADARDRGVHGAALLTELEAAMATATPGRKVPGVTRDPLLRLPEESRLLTLRCQQELARDRQGVLQFEPFLYLNEAGFDGDIVWAREMGPEDLRLAELYSGRAFYRYMVAADGTQRFTPLRPAPVSVGQGENAGTNSAPLLRPDAPNVLLVTVDTLRADHVGAYGAMEARTPTMDALAAEGARFATAIAAAPITLPSHASIMTGLYPPAHGVRHNVLFRLDASFETLAERFRSAGYATAAMIGAIVLAREYGLDQGFDTYDDVIVKRDVDAAIYSARPADEVTDQALAWLEGTTSPFFLWVHYFDPHFPYSPPAPYAEAFPGRPYDGEVAYADAALGRLLAGLREGKRFDNTLIVVTADHGESLGEHDEESHAYTLYDATQRVPLIFRGPNVPAGRLVEGVVSIVDIAPTILSALSLPALAGADGQDLSPLWGDDANSRSRVAYAETLAVRYDHGWSPLHAIRTDRFLYIRSPEAELFDVREDRGQRVNLLSVDAGVPRAGVAEFDSHLDRILAAEKASEPQAVDSATRERLRALGYDLAEGPVEYSGIDPKEGRKWLWLYNKARAEFSGGDYAAAEETLQQLLAVQPTSPLAHRLLAHVYLKQGRLDTALLQAREGIRLAPTSVESRIVLGDVKLLQGDLAAARESYEMGRQLGPREPEPLIGLMKVAIRQERRDEAGALAGQAMEAASHDVPNLLQIGSLLASINKNEQAERVYRRLVSIDPDSETGHAALALVLVRLGRDAESKTHEILAGSVTRTADYRNRVGIAYALRGERERAETVFRELLAEDPNNTVARKNLEQVLRKSR